MAEKENKSSMSICDCDIIGILFAISVITKYIAKSLIKAKLNASKKEKEE